MKRNQTWQIEIGEKHMPLQRLHRSTSKKPNWIIILVCLISIAMIGAYVFPPQRYSSCYFFSTKMCNQFKDWLPPMERVISDEELSSQVVINEILSMTPVKSETSKIAFMFLTPSTLPFEKLWEIFFLVRHFSLSKFIDI